MRSIISGMVVVIGSSLLSSSSILGRTTSPSAPGGVVIQHDSAVARRETGPHDGGGATTAYPFFTDARGLALVFRKRALHRGSAIGYHRNDADEIYYVLSGHGELTVDGVRHEVGPGTAILTRPGSSHGLRQVGTADLVILINYLNEDTRSVRIP